ncbi:unnamed protein product [Eretmochelys imbricata]
MPTSPGLLLLLIVSVARQSLQVLSSLRMAAILDDQTVCGRGERLALALAREHINSISEVPAKARVEVEIFELHRDSQYETTDTMCQILPKGVVSVLGPASSPASAATVSHICGEKEIPHVKVGPEETPRLQYLRFASVSLYPSNEDLSLALARILQSLDYPSASLICAKADLLRLEELVRQFLISKETLSIRMLDDATTRRRCSRRFGTTRSRPSSSTPTPPLSYLVLKKASELGMTSAFYKYILTPWDFPTLHLDDVVDDHSNVVGFSILNVTHPSSWSSPAASTCPGGRPASGAPSPAPRSRRPCCSTRCTWWWGAVRELNRSQEIGVRPLACTSASIWQHGTSLMNYLRMVEYDGLTGRVEFNSKGQRTNYTLRILEKSRNGHREIGVWHSNRTLAMNATTLAMDVSESLANKTLIVTTILENPYVMRRAGAQAPGGAGGLYEGFCVDMLHELAGILKFRFQLRLVEDGLYGAPEANGSWTGMVGELINRKADLAVAAFTITAEREKVIDFSKPFMTLGISILYRVHMGRKPGYFSFLDPFSPAVWLFMLLAYLAVSCVLFLAARLSPYEWHNPPPLPAGAPPCAGEPLHPGQQPLVPHRRLHAAGLRGPSPGPVHALRQRGLVGFHPDHHLVLHGQPGRLPDGAAHGGPRGVGRRPGRPDQHRVRHHPRRLHHDLLPDLPVPDLSADVELHALQAAQRLREEHGGGHRPGAELQIRLPAGVHHERVSPRPGLQPHPDRGAAGHQGLRHRHAAGLPVPGRDHAGHSAAAGEQPAGDPQAQVVGGGQVPQGAGPSGQRPGHGEHRGHFCGSHLRTRGRRLRGCHGVRLGDATLSGDRGALGVPGDAAGAAPGRGVPEAHAVPAAPAAPSPGSPGPSRRPRDAAQQREALRGAPGLRARPPAPPGGARPALHPHPHLPRVPPHPDSAGGSPHPPPAPAPRGGHPATGGAPGPD